MAGVGDDLVTTVTFQVRRQMPVPDQLPVGHDDGHFAGIERCGEQRVGRLRPARTLRPKWSVQPAQCVLGPVEIVPPVPEPEDEVRVVVFGELPQDVAGAEPTANAKHHRLGDVGAVPAQHVRDIG